jgi:nucleoside phosphorylase
MVSDSAWRRHQMPAYHLMAPDRTGITLVNIGVGPSNAKTICDHLAVMRPEAWLMIGHCGGLRPSQRIGDYVLAHAYLRDDHVLDDVLPPEIPVPAIAEVQVALAKAAEIVSGQSGEELKRRLRTGTIVTTDDRNWELRYSRSALRFSLSRAVGIDMESATIAAQGYRFRVPYGTLLCVSDKPLHGELKLPGQANRFYERAISEHMRIGIEACEQLRREGAKLHSRKLRAFDTPDTKPAPKPRARRAPAKSTPTPAKATPKPAAAKPAAKAPPKPRSSKRTATARSKSTVAKARTAASKATDKVGGKWGAAAIAGGVVAAAGAAAAFLLRGSTPKDAANPKSDKAQQPDGTDSSKSFAAGIADENTVPQA